MRGPYDSHGATAKQARLTLDARTAAGMWPVLRPGDTVSFDTQPKCLNVGDLLVFDDGVQRLVWVDPFEALWVRTETIAADPMHKQKADVHGVVTAVVRDGVPVELAQKRPSLTAYVEIGLAVGRRLRAKLPV